MTNMADPLIAVVNAGSSSLKFSLLDAKHTDLRVLIDRLDDSQACQPWASIKDSEGNLLFHGPIAVENHGEAIEWLFNWLDHEKPTSRPYAVGHRVVHGGSTLVKPCLVDAETMALMKSLIPLAPLHQPHNLAPIRYIAELLPHLPQVACFDTAFHATQALVEKTFALPKAYFAGGIRRYGFHGLSYEYVSGALRDKHPSAAQGRGIICHLGNGASLCAVHNGRSIATTMGFTALEGIPMGTRCGSIDPGVLLHLLEQGQMTAAQLSNLLYKQSGLLGLSGLSADMRDLLASGTPEAAEAVEYFCYRIAREIGSLAAALGGLDTLVFTGGIGENAAYVRSRICTLSQWLGLIIEEEANKAHSETLHHHDSAVSIYIIPTNEERIIANHVVELLDNPPA